MLTTIENDILFDDVATLENRLGKDYSPSTSENLSPDCNCSGYTSPGDDEEFKAFKPMADTSLYNDCSN